MRRLYQFPALLSTLLVGYTQRLAAWLQTRMVAGQPGQGLVEYGLILVLIAVVCVGILTLTGETISRVWYDQLINRFP